LQGKAVLRKEPMSKDVKAGDRFTVNDAFISKSYKVKIGMVTAQVSGGGGVRWGGWGWCNCCTSSL
jgi:cullin 3